MRSPEPIQPPTTEPTRPSRSAVSAPSAAFRAASAAVAFSTIRVACGAQGGGAANPPLHDTYQGRKPSSGSSPTTSSTSSLAIGFSFGCPRLALPVLRAAEMRIQPLLVLAAERDARIEFRSVFDVPLREIDVDLRLLPAHALDPFRRDQDLPAGPPVPRVDDAVADRPRLGVDEEVFDVAEVAVRRVDVVAHHVAGAPEVGIRVLPLVCQQLLLERARLGHRDRQGRVGQIAPAIRADPIIRIAVVLRERDLALPVYRAVRVDRRAALHLLLRQRRPEPRGTGDHLKGERRDQDLTARQPRPGIDDEIANGPGVIVEIQILNAADIAVHRLDRDTLEVASSPEHVALLPEVPRPRGLPCLASRTPPRYSSMVPPATSSSALDRCPSAQARPSRCRPSSRSGAPPPGNGAASCPRE